MCKRTLEESEEMTGYKLLSECKTREEAIKSAQTSGISCLSLSRPAGYEEWKFLVQRGFEWGYKFAVKKMSEKEYRFNNQIAPELGQGVELWIKVSSFICVRK